MKLWPTRKARNRVRQQIRERDGDNCHWCGGPMLFGLPIHHHRLMPTIEHIVPRWKGGSDELSNLALAHRICNQEQNAQDQPFKIYTRNPANG